MYPSQTIRRYWKDWDWAAYRAAILTVYFMRMNGVTARDETEAGRELKRLQGHLRRFEGHHFPRYLAIRRWVFDRIADERA